MEKYGDGYGQHIDASGNSVAAGERAEYEYVEQLPTSTAAAASGEEGTRTSVDTSGFGMYSSGTGTGAINGTGILPLQYYATTATAIQTQLPCSPAHYNSSEDNEMGGRMRMTIEEKLVPASSAGMTTGTHGNGQHGETHHDKKGLMDRIKEKLPGHHHHHHHQ